MQSKTGFFIIIPSYIKFSGGYKIRPFDFVFINSALACRLDYHGEILRLERCAADKSAVNIDL